MAVVLDSGIVYAYYDRRDDWHRRARRVIESAPGGLILPALAVAEADYLVARRLGAAAQLTFLKSLADGDYFVADLPRDQYPRLVELNERFAALGIGAVDAAVVATAESMGVPRIATTDLRHFAPLSQALGFTLVPGSR